MSDPERFDLRDEAWWEARGVPSWVAFRQGSYERRMRVVRARRNGLMFKEIAACMGVSTPRARKLYLDGLEALKRPSPVEALWLFDDTTPTDRSNLRRYFRAVTVRKVQP